MNENQKSKQTTAEQRKNWNNQDMWKGSKNIEKKMEKRYKKLRKIAETNLEKSWRNWRRKLKKTQKLNGKTEVKN